MFTLMTEWAISDATDAIDTNISLHAARMRAYDADDTRYVILMFYMYFFFLKIFEKSVWKYG